jgi:hypothetical protein
LRMLSLPEWPPSHVDGVGPSRYRLGELATPATVPRQLPTWWQVELEASATSANHSKQKHAPALQNQQHTAKRTIPVIRGDRI